MKAYIFDTVTKEYKGVMDLQIDPLETKKAKKTVYMYPPNVTGILPPESGEKEVAVFIDGAWKLVSDHRGEESVIIDENGWPIGLGRIEVLGDVNIVKPFDVNAFIRPKYVNSKWVEGATPEEIIDREIELEKQKELNILALENIKKKKPELDAAITDKIKKLRGVV